MRFANTPVFEHGTSSRTQSNLEFRISNSELRSASYGTTITLVIPRRSIFSLTNLRRSASMSVAIISAESPVISANCVVFVPGAAHKSSIRQFDWGSKALTASEAAMS